MVKKGVPGFNGSKLPQKGVCPPLILYIPRRKCLYYLLVPVGLSTIMFTLFFDVSPES
jgi:hypothetical protein